jgi:two-component system, cell cycle sensor histidine kinase and response regulator CckA
MVATMIEQAMRIEIEERMGKSSKMEALGQLAAGVSHDFSNVLQGISLEGEKLLTVANDSAQVALGAREIMRHTDRGARLVRQLLAFGKPSKDTAVRADARATLVELTPILETLLRDPWFFELETPDAPIFTALDRTEFEQIVMNLVVNARDSMPAGGRIHVRLSAEAEGTSACLLSVSDHGTGINPATRDRIFEPFFTTKPPESGTGLGLSIVRRVVERVRGEIEIDSEIGKGSTFRIRIPCVSSS